LSRSYCRAEAISLSGIFIRHAILGKMNLIERPHFFSLSTVLMICNSFTALKKKFKKNPQKIVSQTTQFSSFFFSFLFLYY
jgi:hypothetical protein